MVGSLGGRVGWVSMGDWLVVKQEGFLRQGMGGWTG